MRPCAFLLACTLAAVAYGVANDQLTVTLSPEYIQHYARQDGFCWQAAGPLDPSIRWTAAEMGARATWWFGAGCGAAVWLANRWRRRAWPCLPDRRLLSQIALVVLSAAAATVAGGLVGLAAQVALGETIAPEPAPASIQRPDRFALVGCMHLGGYVGGFLGALAAVARVLRERTRLALRR